MFIFNVFVNLVPVWRSENRCNMRKFWSFNHSRCKRVINLLEAVYLRLRKIDVQRVTVVKFGENSQHGTSCFSIKVRTDARKFPDMRIAGN